MLRTIILLVLPLLSANLWAAEKIMVLEFGLDDDTLLPNVSDEKDRVASLAPYVTKGLASLGYEASVNITADEMKAQIANGYLIKFPAAALDIAEAGEFRWLAIGKLRKFSFMESWIRLYLYDVKRKKLVGHAEAEVRGHMTDDRMTQRTAFSLAEQIDGFIRELSTPPPQR